MAITAEEMQAMVTDLYAATGSGDWDRAETMLTDDFFVTEADPFPFAGVYRGKGALRELFTTVMEMMDVAGFDIVETTAGKDHAVTILSFTFTDPALEPAPLCELFRFRDGKVCEIRPYYFDPAPMLAACAAKARLDTAA